MIDQNEISSASESFKSVRGNGQGQAPRTKSTLYNGLDLKQRSILN